ncbi:hypothetical protein ACAG25_17515 [Mycobacterium sp. pV006]|uniref:hypothetical protein n=1 Tax=Mycobacterium sp. pV006 TaxID=3238983 RepID=UPI00351B01B4
MLEIELGDWATWVGSIGTIGAFIVAFWQIRRERVERQKREHREWWERRRAHADRVSAWATTGQVRIRNASGHPIHDVVVICANGSEHVVDLVPPGDHDRSEPGLAPGPVTVEFTDQRGERWRREPGQPPHVMDGKRQTD